MEAHGKPGQYIFILQLLLVDYWLQSQVLAHHYFVVAKSEIDLKELYSNSQKYKFKNGFNVNALITLLVAGVLSLIGNFVSFFEPLYEMSWFVGIISSFILYCLLEMRNIKKIQLQ